MFSGCRNPWWYLVNKNIPNVVFSVVWLSAHRLWAYGCRLTKRLKQRSTHRQQHLACRAKQEQASLRRRKRSWWSSFYGQEQASRQTSSVKISSILGKHTKWRKMPDCVFAKWKVFVELGVRGASYAVSCWSNRRLNCFLAFWRPNQDHQLHYVLSHDQQTPKNVTRPVFRVAIFQDHRLRGALEKDLLWKPVRD